MKLPYDFERARLKLALLKENFEFQDFYKKLKDSPLCDDVIRRPGESEREYFERRLAKAKASEPYVRNLEYFGLNPDAFDRFYIYRYKLRVEDILNVLDPSREIDQVSDKILLCLWPYEWAIVMVDLTRKTQRNLPLWYAKEGGDPELFISGLHPGKVLLKIDLRRGKKQLLKEFKEFLDMAYEEDAFKQYLESLEKAPLTNLVKRKRKEVWRHLDVWKLRKQRYEFKVIASKLGISLDVAKKSFYRAFELTQWKRYDPDLFKPQTYIEVKGLCADCPNRSTCTEPCPEVLRYINQDTRKYPREAYLPEDSDKFKDYLFQQYYL